MRTYLTVFFLFIQIVLVRGQIKSGPMLGYTTMMESAVWVQLEKEDSIRMVYYPTSNPLEKQSVSALSDSKNGNTVHLIARNLEPGTDYSFKLLIAGKEVSDGTFSSLSLWQHRTDPPNFNFAVGSCAYINESKYDRPGEPYGRGYQIFESINQKNPAMMLWLGDNIYLREADWTSRSGIYHRYTAYKSLPELQALWKSMPHYAIWDDHDFGPNDGDRSFVNKEISLEAFKSFWANMDYGVNGNKGITSQFTFNDIDFFLLDNRFFRTPNNRKTGERYILGDEQVQWLIDALVNSKASFKMVAIGGQFLSTAEVYENHANYGKERKQLLELIEQEGIKNIVFLSGDRHKTELSELRQANGNVIYDFTCSPLTSKAYDSYDEGNTLQLEGTHVSTQNFGILKLSGKWNERILSIQTFDKNGALIWEKNIHQQ